MAPMKRPAAAPAAGAAPAKKQAAGFTKKIAEVEEAVLDSEALPMNVRKMLCSDLSSSLGVPKDQRHPYQDRVVGMIGEALSAVEAAAKKQAEEADAMLAECDAEKGRLETMQGEKMAALHAQMEAEKATKLALEAAVEAHRAAKAALGEAETEQKEGDEQYVVSAGEKSTLDAAMQDSFLKLKEGGVEETEAKEKMALLAKLGGQYEFGGSMMTSLPSALNKAPGQRGDFDNMVLKAFEDEFQTRIAKVDEVLAAGAPAKEERAEKVVAATTALTEAAEAEAAAKAEVESAIAATTELEGAYQEATKSVKEFMKDMKTKVAQAAAAKKALHSLEKGALAAFKELEAYVPAPPTSSQYKTIKGVRYEKDLLELAASEESEHGALTEASATKLFAAAMDGNVVTPTEKRTIKYVLNTYKCDDAAKAYLEAKMGSSWYQSIEGVTYERLLLQLAADESKPIGMEGAEKLWKSAMDRNEVTPTEKRTLEYILAHNAFAEDAKSFLEEKIAAAEAGVEE